MLLKELEKGEIKEFVKLMFECNEDLKRIFGDEYLGREIIENCYRSFESYEGIFVLKRERIFGFIELKISEIDRRFPIKPFLIMGFIKVLKIRLLLGYFDKKPKRNEVYIRNLCAHPNLDLERIGEILIDKAIDFAMEKGKNIVSIWLPVESDFVDVCIGKGFEIKRMLESSFAKKHFGRKYYYFLQLRLK